MLNAFVVVLVLAVALRLAARWLGDRTRRVGSRALPVDGITRAARGVPVRVLLQGAPLLGLSTRHANRTRADLLLAGDRFVLSTNRGVLADLGPGRGRKFTSVRCTAPGRLVLEGDVPQPNKPAGLFRVEVPFAVAADAEEWVTLLAPFVRPPEPGRPRFGSAAPAAPGSKPEPDQDRST